MMEIKEKQNRLNKVHKLSCIYCLGPVRRTDVESIYFITLKCCDCGRTQMIYKTDYKSYLNWEGDY